MSKRKPVRLSNNLTAVLLGLMALVGVIVQSR